jgi:hypothetical protein
VNKLQRNKYLAIWREKNREKIRQQHNAWYEAHKHEEKLKADKARFFKDWAERNKEHRVEYTKKWVKSNPEKVKARKRREKLALLANPKTRLELNLRQRVQKALKAQGARKHGKTYDLLGMSAKELRTYIESKFVEGMNWENYGQWHIDHIRPISSFNLMEAEQQKIAFHYSNLQPLWAVDNLKKGKRHDTQTG